jgi:glycerol-3-phosphate acyltransferase PlsY
MNAVLTVGVAYLVGSIPFAFLLAHHRGIDLRRAGSGNVGAANVLRTTGVRAAILAMMLDALKGAIAVLTARSLAVEPVTVVVAGVASVVGHAYPVWLRFRGGKGVATSAGVFALLAPEALAIACSVFLIVVILTRFISVGSIAGALTLVLAAAMSDAPGVVAAGATASAIVVIYRHRENLARLRAGTERRIGQRVVEESVR